MIRIQRMDDIPEEYKENPFRFDHFHCGQSVGENVLIMFSSSKDTSDYIIVINKETGERIRIAFNEKGSDPNIGEHILNEPDFRLSVDYLKRYHQKHEGNLAS